MTVRYVRVKASADMFSPVVRAYGNIGVVGTVDVPEGAAAPDDLLEVAVPVLFTDPAEAVRRAPGDLGASIRTAFSQTPGPTVVVGVRVATDNPQYPAALETLAAHDVQIVFLAGTPVAAAGDGPVDHLVSHVVNTSQTGGDGKERIGVAMLAKGATDPAVRGGERANERMVYVAHKSDDDVAAAVAGTIAGYEPHISLLLKKVNIDSDPFTPADIRALNGDEADDSPPAGKGVNWLTSPSLIPGGGVYLGEGYTGNPAGKKYVDVVRCMDNVTFLLKARLVNAIGNLRISRSGLRALVAQMEAVLDPLVGDEVIDDYEVVIPVLALLDKDPDTLTAAELEQLKNLRQSRLVQVLSLVTYAGAIHRLSISLTFQ